MVETIRGIKTWAVPVLCYTTDIIDLAQAELEAIDPRGAWQYITPFTLEVKLIVLT